MDLVTLALAKSYIDKRINEGEIVTGATPQQAAQIEQNKTDIADLQTDVDELKESGGNGSGQNVNPVPRTEEMTQPVGMDADGSLWTAPGGLVDDPEANPPENTATDFLGYTGIQFFDNGNIRAYSPIVNTTAWNERCRKVSAALQSAAESAALASTDGVLAHECSVSDVFSSGNLLLTWVENIDGTGADVPNHTGVTAVKGRMFTVGINPNFPSATPGLTAGGISIIAQMGDEATNTLTGETFTIQGGVGYQTSIDKKVLCGYVPGYAKLAGMTCTVTEQSGKPVATSRDTWTLTIDGELGEYDYSRLPDSLRNATLHPSNQVAKIGSTYYRADVVPRNGFVVLSSSDLINWVYVGHAALPHGFDDKSAVEACCGAKRSRLYVAVRQEPESACLYLAKMNTDMHTINSCVALPDCGSKPCFSGETSIGGKAAFYLATAPADRYGCRVYCIPSDYNLTHIYPAFELHGRACNYPFIVNQGIDPAWLIVAGTNGAQTDKAGVCIVPASVYRNIVGQPGLPASTDNIVHTAEGAVAFGKLYGD